MNAYSSHRVARDILRRYSELTRQSQIHNEKAKRWLPGGDTRRVSYHLPYPAYMERGEGCFLYDCDGNRYIDFQNNYTSMIHGHAFSPVVELIREQAEKGIALGAPGEIQYRHAEHLCSRVPSLDMVRYPNSGTEATMFCMRTARAFTGRHAILKIDGGYHGQHEFAQVNIFPDVEAQGLPASKAEPWIPPGVVDEVKVAPFNDLEATEQVLQKNKDRIAAIILEPVLGAGGQVVPQPGYLKGLRELADKYGALLIFDEVMTFRQSRGGMQELEGVTPDLTALGKIIGGGFPIGAFGGRDEVMDMFRPDHPHPVFHSGTFNANNITMAAGLANLEAYDQAAIDRLKKLGGELKEGFKGAFTKAGVKGQITGVGSILHLHWMEREPLNARESALGLNAAGDLPGLLHLELMNRGIFAAYRGMFCLSTPMTEKEIQAAVNALEGTLVLLKPYIADVHPNLLMS